MPDHSTSRLPSKPVAAELLPSDIEPETPALAEPAADAVTAPANGTKKNQRSSRTKRATLPAETEVAEADSAPVAANGGQETAPTESPAGA